MDPEYLDVRVIGEASFDEELITRFVDFIEDATLPKTHYIGDGSVEDNPAYNKYIIRDDSSRVSSTPSRSIDTSWTRWFIRPCCRIPAPRNTSA